MEYKKRNFSCYYWSTCFETINKATLFELSNMLMRTKYYRSLNWIGVECESNLISSIPVYQRTAKMYMTEIAHVRTQPKILIMRVWGCEQQLPMIPGFEKISDIDWVNTLWAWLMLRPAVHDLVNLD